MRNYLVLSLIILFGGSVLAGEWFPKEYKVFRYKEGDLLSYQSDGLWGLTKILKVDKIHLKTGDTISIQGQRFKAPIDDHLLVVSTSFSEPVYSSLDELKDAVKKKSWKVKIGHVPRRAPGVGEGSVFLGNEIVTESELSGYKQWKSAFDKKEAGIF